MSVLFTDEQHLVLPDTGWMFSPCAKGLEERKADGPSKLKSNYSARINSELKRELKKKQGGGAAGCAGGTALPCAIWHTSFSPTEY